MPERRGYHEPVTVSEVARWMERHESDSDETHKELVRAIEKLMERADKSDDRMDRIAVRVTVIFAVVSVLWAIFLVLAPFIRLVIGLPGG